MSRNQDHTPISLADTPSSELAAVIDSAPVMTWMTGPSPLAIFFNRTWLDFTGRSLQQELGEGWLQGVHPMDRARRQHEFGAAFQARRQFKLEYRLLRRDGAYRWVLDLAVPRQSASGQFAGYTGSCVDITEQITAEQSAHAERERLEVTLRSIGDGVIVTDSQARTLFLNPVAEELTGWKQAEAHGNHLELVFNIIHEFTREKVPNPALISIREGKSVALANHAIIVSKNGFERPIADTAAPIRDKLGRIEGCVLVFRDVTEHKRAHANHARLAALVAGSDDAIVGKNLQGIIQTWNAAAERIFGYTEAEAIGRPITLIIPKERWPEEADIIARLKKGERVDHFETIRLRKDGTPVEISLTVSPIKDPEGNVIGASKIARDITHRKQMQRSLEMAQQQLRSYADNLELKVQERTSQLKESIAEVEAFSYTVSHDLRAPLRAMQQYSSLLLEDYADKLGDEAKGHLQSIVRAGIKLDHLITDVLRYSRTFRAEMPLANIQLEKIITDILSESPVLQAPRSRITFQAPLLPVRGNELFLIQCISNLLDNAVKFVPPGRIPQVRLWTERRGPNVRLWLEDNGIGIDPASHQRIFELFERMHGDKEYAGTGIGLAIVRKAVQRMGGAVGVESTPGQGSRFWLELPAAAETISPPKPPAHSDEALPLSPPQPARRDDGVTSKKGPE